MEGSAGRTWAGRGTRLDRAGCETGRVPEQPDRPERLAYLDHAATTPLRPGARDAMLPWLGERFEIGRASCRERVSDTV